MLHQRKLPIGAELQSDGAHFRVWAPARRRVTVVLEAAAAREIELTAEKNGYFAGLAPGIRAGARYRFRLDGEDRLLPDPASRFQPEGPFGPSEIIDPTRFAWTDWGWRGVTPRGQVIYEMHIGTFTREGTWDAASRQLPRVAELGVTLLEVMPISDFPGKFGWGYDGVDFYAPTRLYGTPDDFRRFVDTAHGLGMGVILDVVYNHAGPDGNYLRDFSPSYFTDRYDNEWGDALNFDGDDSGPVREFFVQNARYWIDEYHLDGLRLDATQQIFDSSPIHVLAEVRRAVRSAAAGRGTFVVAENETQEARLVRAESDGGCELDALWNDDFHHSAIVAMTGRSEAYYTDYRGNPQELLSACKWGFLYQGQWYSWQKKQRGTPALDVPIHAFVQCIENHDQVANSARGERLWRQVSPARYRAITALLLLAPPTPMLFQGQEFASSAPFLFFADHRPELALAVRRGRTEFLAQFKSLQDPQIVRLLADPSDPGTFEQCKLDLEDLERHREVHQLHRDLLKLRREVAPFRHQARGQFDGAVLGPESLAMRFFDALGDRLLLVNLGADEPLLKMAEPLLAPPPDGWRIAWSSEHPDYGGSGRRLFDASSLACLPAETALVLAPASDEGTTT